jgi:hypothetical protein
MALEEPDMLQSFILAWIALESLYPKDVKTDDFYQGILDQVDRVYAGETKANKVRQRISEISGDRNGLGGHPKCTGRGHFKVYQGSVATLEGESVPPLR